MKLYSFLKYFINTLIFIVSLCVITNANAGSTYFGIDALYSNTRLKKDFGGNVFSRRMAPGVNFSLGHMFNNNFGAEVGFEIDDRNSDVIYVPGNEAVFGILQNNPDLHYALYKSKVNQNYKYIGITTTTTFNNNFISLLIAESLSSIKAKTNLLGEIIDDIFGDPEFISRDNISIFNKNKLIPIIKISFGYKNNDYFINLFSSWKNTSKINIKSQDSPDTMKEIIKFKNTCNFGIRLGYIF